MPRFVKIKEMLNSGVIGEIRFATIELYQPPLNTAQALPWRVQPEIAGGGLFLDVGSHALDLLDFYFGPVQQVKGFASNQGGFYPAEDLVTATFVHRKRGPGSWEFWCFTGFKREDQIEIVGSKGKISFALLAADPVKLTTLDRTEGIQPGLSNSRPAAFNSTGGR